MKCSYLMLNNIKQLRMEDSLKNAKKKDICMVCFESCGTITSCCKNYLCNKCTTRWWEYKRQCPACKKDMIDFDTWVKKYKNDQKTLTEEEDEGDTLTLGNLYIALQFFFNLEDPPSEGPQETITSSNSSEEIPSNNIPSIQSILDSIAECMVRDIGIYNDLLNQINSQENLNNSG